MKKRSRKLLKKILESRWRRQLQLLPLLCLKPTPHPSEGELLTAALLIPIMLITYSSLVAQMVKPTMRETRVQSLGREDPLEKEMATHSSILAWKIPWTEEPDGL